MKVDPLPASIPAGNVPAPSMQAERSATGSAPPTPTDSGGTSRVSIHTTSPVAVNYQLAENGHKVYFQVIDENTGQVVVQVPSEAVLKGEEQLYDFLQEQSKRTRVGKE